MIRRAADTDATAQMIAANVDVFCLVTSANRDFNPRRIERYLTAVWESGANPVVVLNKVDLVDDLAPLAQDIAAVALGVPTVAPSPGSASTHYAPMSDAAPPLASLARRGSASRR
jgi:ribosome biogenesis GTPase